MYLSEMRVQNYKSFLDSDSLHFRPGFNVIIGQNDVGKSALVDALSLAFENKPHKSPVTMRRANTRLNPISQVAGVFHLTAPDTSEMLEGTEFLFVRTKMEENPDNAVRRFLDTLQAEIEIAVSRHPQGTTGQLKGFNPEASQQRNIAFRNAGYPSETQLQLEDPSSAKGTEIGSLLAGFLQPRVYGFKAERLNIGESEITTGLDLATNASNLPGVVHALQSSNRPLFDEYLERVHTVFPQIANIATPPVTTSRTRIDLWRGALEREVAHLATPLSESGTGIGQVLAILYVAVTARHSRVIVIDEPQSFLHPGAVRKLIDVLRDYSHHQYIITTHSPTALLHTNPSTLLLVERPQFASVVRQLDPRETSDLRTTLIAVGAQISDVYGADEVLWVEGPTEELCFPIIVDRILHRPRPGLQISGVASTGDLASRHADRAYDIYHRLTTGNHLLPRRYAFAFDREDRSESTRNRLEQLSGGLVHFLPRRSFENYLLEPEVIAAELNARDAGREVPLTGADVRNWVERYNSRYLKSREVREKAQVWGDLWRAEVDAARLLSSVFPGLSEHRIQYDKVVHGPNLLKRLIDVKFVDLHELARFLESVLAVLGRA